MYAQMGYFGVWFVVVEGHQYVHNEHMSLPCGGFEPKCIFPMPGLCYLQGVDSC